MKRLVSLCASFLLLTSCTFYSGDDLLLAPQPTKNFVALQEQLRKILDGGAIYAVPQTGQNRSTVQLVDLDGDGTEEAVAFFRDSSTASTFTAYVFKKQQDAYVLSDSVSGHGLSVQSVEYPRLRPSGEKGIAISWGLEDGQSCALSLCDFNAKGKISTLLTTDYINYRFADLTGDNTDELFLISSETGKGRSAALYEYQDGKVAELGRASVSHEAMSIVRLTVGFLEGGIPAIFAEERPDSGSGLMTDIFAYYNDQLHNISQNTESGVSNGSYRAMSVYATDIDGDHVTELPQNILMQGFSDPTQPDALYLLDWYSYSADGIPRLKRTTYHNISEDWSFRFPEEWRNRVTAVKDTANGVNRTTFCEYVAEGENPPICTIYSCNSEQVSRLSALEGLIPLSEVGNIYFAASVATGSSLAITAEELQSRFKVLTTDWMG